MQPLFFLTPFYYIYCVTNKHVENMPCYEEKVICFLFFFRKCTYYCVTNKHVENMPCYEEKVICFLFFFTFGTYSGVLRALGLFINIYKP